MKTINVAIGLHNHQPVGNFDFVFEDAYNKCYQPFLEILERHPQIRIAQHYTGILLEWLQQHKPEFIPRLRAMVEREQLEMMTGGFYEPILSVIPDGDKVGQIRKLTQYVRDNTGYEARGMWLAERIWEPHLPKPCREADVDYVVLDDSHFKCAGLREDELLGSYLTEENGSPIRLFPICERLRYSIPFASPEETIDIFREHATEDGRNLIVYADDGEKFGVWPKTYQHCYEDGWLESFFQVLENNLDWINLIHLSEAVDDIPPIGRIYLPTASYREMMEWAMPTRAIHEYEHLEEILKQQQLHDRYKSFVRGGFWRNFMMKYPESNNMHKAMLHLSRRVERMAADFSEDERFQRARDHLWAGQCNCPYWHGVFGGLYLNHLRFAIYRELSHCETLLDELEHGAEAGEWQEHHILDLDGDGFDEIYISNPHLSMTLAPNQGGTITGLNFKPAAVNIMDTMTRREEAYHKTLLDAANQQGNEEGDNVASIHDIVQMKEPGLDKKLVFDAYRQFSGIDHFLSEGTTLETFSRCEHEAAGDFVGAGYAYTLQEDGSELVVNLSREGSVLTGAYHRVSLDKRLVVTPEQPGIKIQYNIRNLESNAIELWFGTEWDFALLAGDAPDRYFRVEGQALEDSRLRSSGEIAATSKVELVDEWLNLRISLTCDQECNWWRFPIETISQSEGGFERVYQSSVIMPHWRFRLEPGDAWRGELVVGLSRYRGDHGAH